MNSGAGFFLSVFVTVFLAELADKTQLATMAFSLQGGVSRTAVFLAASSALVLSTALAVLLSASLTAYLSELPLSRISGVLFIIIGIFTLVRS